LTKIKCIVCGKNEIEEGNTPHNRRALCSSGRCFNAIYEIADQEGTDYNTVWNRLFDEAYKKALLSNIS